MSGKLRHSSTMDVISLDSDSSESNESFENDLVSADDYNVLPSEWLDDGNDSDKLQQNQVTHKVLINFASFDRNSNSISPLPFYLCRMIIA